ncbi:MAG: hypothetical protein M1826_005714 [Phylliscum demangeonii]|nr:MAG: hypothetical protein M1826_005714 [Phylliscum demangeonii]
MGMTPKETEPASPTKRDGPMHSPKQDARPAKFSLRRNFSAGPSEPVLPLQVLLLKEEYRVSPGFSFGLRARPVGLPRPGIPPVNTYWDPYYVPVTGEVFPRRLNVGGQAAHAQWLGRPLRAASAHLNTVRPTGSRITGIGFTWLQVNQARDTLLNFHHFCQFVEVWGLRQPQSTWHPWAPFGSALARQPIPPTLHHNERTPDICSASNAADAPIVLNDEEDDDRHSPTAGSRRCLPRRPPPRPSHRAPPPRTPPSSSPRPLAAHRRSTARHTLHARITAPPAPSRIVVVGPVIGAHRAAHAYASGFSCAPALLVVGQSPPSTAHPPSRRHMPAGPENSSRRQSSAWADGERGSSPMDGDSPSPSPPPPPPPPPPPRTPSPAPPSPTADLPPEFNRLRRAHQGFTLPLLDEPSPATLERVRRPYGGSVPAGAARERLDPFARPTDRGVPSLETDADTPLEAWPLPSTPPPSHPDGAAPWIEHGVLLGTSLLPPELRLGRWHVVVGGFDRRHHFIRRVHNYDRIGEILPPPASSAGSRRSRPTRWITSSASVASAAVAFKSKSRGILVVRLLPPLSGAPCRTGRANVSASIHQDDVLVPPTMFREACDETTAHDPISSLPDL